MWKKIFILCFISILIVALMVANINKNQGSITIFNTVQSYTVKARKIEKKSITSFISANGYIEEVESTQVYFDTSLKIKKLNVDKDMKVIKGDKLLELDMDSLYSQLSQLKIDRTILALSTEKTKPNLLENDVSAIGVKSAVNSLKSSHIAYDNALKNYNISKALFNSGAISKSDLETAKKNVEDADITIKNTELELENAELTLKKSKNTVANRDIDNTLEIQTQEENLKSLNLKISDLQDKINKILETTLSPIDGVITEKKLFEGGYTSVVEPAFKIVNIDKLRIRAQVSELGIKNVAVGQMVKITGDAMGKEDSIHGTVQSISPIAKKNLQAAKDQVVVDVIITIDKTNTLLKPGLSVTCDITTTVKSDALVASYEMLKEGKDGNKLVFIVDEKTGIIHERQVNLGIKSELDVEVLHGINENELVVLYPLPAYKDGDKVILISGETK